MMRLVTRTSLGARVSLLAVAAAATALTAGCAAAATPAAAGGSHTATRVTGSPVPAATTPVPTTTAGPPTAPGEPACAGWPANVVHDKALPASFAPVAVIRCVEDYQMIPGKGQWQTATLERADKNLAPLIAALRTPSAQRTPGTACPAIVMVPPQVVLVDRAGNAIWPALPTTGCGLVQSQVLTELSALSWQTVSVRLVARVQTQQEVASGSASSRSRAG